MAFGDESFLDLIAAWDGAGVVVHFDQPTGSWIFIAIHDATLGPATGGTRMKVYSRPEEGLRDALRLASGMTAKWASVDLPFGGGKAVLATPGPLEGRERQGLLRRYGALLNTLDGAFGTGEDFGTTPDDMLEIASVSGHVVQVHGSADGPSDPGPFTALGVFAGMRAALEQVHGQSSLDGRTVLIQGVGDVGAPLARLVSNAGGSVLLCDIDSDLAFALSVEFGGSVVKPENVYRTPCDVFAPCALGAILNGSTIPLLQCRVVAGSANNQLETDQDAERLHERGILYAPDYVINSGGALAFGLIQLGAHDVEVLETRVKGIGGMLAEIFADALVHDVSPVHSARRRVERVLAKGRG
ncbi:MAG: hypothetical protein O2992_02155 [Gemmatimonadetes bacterium]|nr:hypothetical protein [Gemmatimonadota bacterium]